MLSVLHIPWPASEAWFSWAVGAAAVASMGTAVLAGVEWNRRTIVAALAVGATVWYSAALYYDEQVLQPKRDYVYLILPPAQYQNVLRDGTVQLWTQSTATFTSADTCWLRTADYKRGNPFWCRLPRFSWPVPEGYRPSSIVVGMDDWTFDLDAPNRNGPVRQRLNIAMNNGVVVLLFSQVTRKSLGAPILCETPKREGIPKCQ
jgi:hypothetical protein